MTHSDKLIICFLFPPQVLEPSMKKIHKLLSSGDFLKCALKPEGSSLAPYYEGILDTPSSELLPSKRQPAFFHQDTRTFDTISFVLQGLQGRLILDRENVGNFPNHKWIVSFGDVGPKPNHPTPPTKIEDYTKLPWKICENLRKKN